MSCDNLVPRSQVIAVLLANAVLWAAATLVTGDHRVAGPAVIALASISTLLWRHSARAPADTA